MSNALSRIAALRAKTAPGLLAEHARSKPTAVAFRAKHLGLYRERTWRQFAEMVGRAARALASLGLARGERIAIMADACEEWMVIDQGAQALGAIVYGIYPTASIAELEYQMGNGGATLFVAENQEYVDKILPILDRLPQVRAVVVIDTTAMFAYDHPKLRSYDDVVRSVALDGEAALAVLEAHAQRLDPRTPAFIVYTSGTTGHPKGALIAHGTHLAATATFLAHYPTLVDDEHRTVAYLPLCHVLGRNVAITLPLLSRVIPHFGETVEDLPATFFEVAPTMLVTVPRYLQKFASQALVGVGTSSKLKRAVYDWAMRRGRDVARQRWEGRVAFGARALYEAARAIAFRPLLNKLGCDQLQLVLSGGAALPAETMALWQIWGVNVLELYGQTEQAGAMVTGQRSPFPRPGSVGDAAAGVSVKLDADGQILVRIDDRFAGYWGNDAATREVLGEDGWIRTGDIGEWVGGAAANAAPPSLRLMDRARDFIVTSGGKTLSPSFIENILRASPYVAEAVVFGHNRKYLSALIEIDFDTVADWARAHNIVYTGFTSLAQHPRVVALLQSEIDKTNRELARVEGIKAFRILPKALDPEEEGEPVTPTRKVKRGLMYERFKALVESMYDDREEQLVAAGAGNVLG
jgi:long-chain acyl-CoA synthetase